MNFNIFYSNIARFIYLSTAEVFGPAPQGVTHKEYDRYNSGNPYAAAKVIFRIFLLCALLVLFIYMFVDLVVIRYKFSYLQAAAEEFAVAYENTYKMPIVVVHTMNVFGERQLPSKYIPKVVHSVMQGNEVKFHN